MRGFVLAVLLIIGAIVHVVSLGKAADGMKQLPHGDEYAFVVPSPILKIATLEFQGLASDILFLRSIVFLGGTFERTERPRVKEWEWKWLASVLDTATELDPYFLDPYYFANAYLPWDAGMANEANRILKKGSRYREWDWVPPFFVGFNDFFFLKDDVNAADYIMEASRRPGSNPMLASLASRLAYKGNRIETAILFLEEISRGLQEESMKKLYETRIRALRTVQVIEQSVAVFKKKFGRTPSNIGELVNRKILRQLPEDPYGGTYYLDADGQVRSTITTELGPYLSPFMKKQMQ